MELILAFFISNILGVMYDYLYKIIFPYNIIKHKPYLDKASLTFIQIFLNTFANCVLSLRILKGISIYKIRQLIRTLIQIGIFIIFYEYLS